MNHCCLIPQPEHKAKTNTKMKIFFVFISLLLHQDLQTSATQDVGTALKVMQKELEGIRDVMRKQEQTITLLMGMATTFQTGLTGLNRKVDAQSTAIAGTYLCV